ncbi:MAG: redox-sensing transcriptional repressor Rex [Oscillospiraceae bacterium]|nr:redox-sensing transcriptional repressor Rex [Candidatus Equicaccousia limihippi]
MNEKKEISPFVIKRFPRYYRFLEKLKQNREMRISSGELAKRMGLTASQIRQDFNTFGGFGQQGYGYNTAELCDSIADIMGLNHPHNIILIGAGNLGRAIAGHMNFKNYGFILSGVFDKNESFTGQIIKDMPIRSVRGLENFCKDNSPEAAILCIPDKEAEKIVPQLISYGIKAFWNFSHYDVALNHPLVSVQNVHLSDSLMRLSFDMKQAEEK